LVVFDFYLKRIPFRCLLGGREYIATNEPFPYTVSEFLLSHTR